MTSSESEEQPHTSRKRSRRSNSGDDGGAGGKKARGRPRVDTQDATAADRRRTQIRLAQRAYRQRKETTISSLKNQSIQLHSIIEQMNKTFLKLNESAVKSGLLQLNPTLSHEFKLVTETFANLVKTASEGQHEGDEDGEQGYQGTAERNGAQQPVEPDVEAHHAGWGYSTASNPDDPKRPQQQQQQQQQLSTPDSYLAHISAAYGNVDTSRNDLISCRVFPPGSVFDQSTRTSQPPDDPPSLHTSSQRTQLPFGLVDLHSQQSTPFASSNPHIYSVRIPTPDVTPPINRLPTPPPTKILTKTLQPVTIYSFEETTFARRLSRAALEAGFHLLSRANDRPTAIDRVFKLSLSHQSLDQIRNRFRTLMSRNIDEDLDWWDTPFIHLGGAGTHYPRSDAAGLITRVRNGWNLRQVGPPERRVYIIENTEDGRSEELGDLDLSGYEGQWFDCYDVQGLLEDKYACKLDPRSSFAECIIDEEDEEVPEVHADALRPRANMTTELPRLSNNSTNTSTTPSTTSTNRSDQPYTVEHDGAFGLGIPFGHTGDFPKLINYELSYDQTLGLDLAPGYTYDFSHPDGFHISDMDLGMGTMNDATSALPVVKQKRRKHGWIDVSRLIDEIIVRGVCLGRSPGYRRKDVDLAVRKALVHEH